VLQIEGGNSQVMHRAEGDGMFVLEREQRIKALLTACARFLNAPAVSAPGHGP
jgi:hypothetical protein